MNTAELERILATARAAGHEAASLVLNGFRKHPHVEHKGAVDLVTSLALPVMLPVPSTSTEMESVSVFLPMAPVKVMLPSPLTWMCAFRTVAMAPVMFRLPSLA